MNVRLTKIGGDEPLFEGKVPKKGVILRIEDGDAEIQFEVTERETRVSGDGGRNGSWEIELAVPRLKEPPQPS